VSKSDLTNQEDEHWMALALEQARRAASLGEVPVGAVAVLDDKIIGRGFNMKELVNDPTAHAELIAIKKAAEFQHNWRLIGVTLYSTLEPCPMCAGAMIQARLERLVYGARDIRFGADGSVVDILADPRFNHRVVVTSGVREDEAAGLMRDFFRRLREKNQSG
jgi:tRNA(adenine34) deaminase